MQHKRADSVVNAVVGEWQSDSAARDRMKVRCFRHSRQSVGCEFASHEERLAFGKSIVDAPKNRAGPGTDIEDRDPIEFLLLDVADQRFFKCGPLSKGH